MTEYNASTLYIYGLASDCDNCITNALEVLQSCIKPLHFASFPNQIDEIITIMAVNLFNIPVTECQPSKAGH